jgi:hypothetical protein
VAAGASGINAVLLSVEQFAGQSCMASFACTQICESEKRDSQP